MHTSCSASPTNIRSHQSGLPLSSVGSQRIPTVMSYPMNTPSIAALQWPAGGILFINSSAGVLRKKSTLDCREDSVRNRCDAIAWYCEFSHVISRGRRRVGSPDMRITLSKRGVEGDVCKSVDRETAMVRENTCKKPNELGRNT